MKWYLKVLRHFADFSGRASRKEFWMFALLNIAVSFLVGIVITLLLFLFSSSFLEERDFIFMAYKLAFIYQSMILLPSMAVAIRRLHDVGKSGWMLLISFIPLIGGIWLLVLFLSAGQQEANKYGEHPDKQDTERKFDLRTMSLYLISAFGFFGIFTNIQDFIEMIINLTEHSVDISLYISSIIFDRIMILLYIALIILAVGLYKNKNSSKNRAIVLIIACVIMICSQIYFILDKGNLYTIIWLFISSVLLYYAVLLLQQKGNSKTASISLIAASSVWTINILLSNISMIINIPDINPDHYFFQIFRLILPISIFLFGMSIWKNNKI
ncbi:DUF805 domain-containing protein [Bacteroidales bacterium OttesenSCG-928-I14]|nr:DUF805 domain-containing protein [Bacteroidales bacterium OttesenSCG-928-I14]